MTLLLNVVLFAIISVLLVQGDRQAPGVNPSVYEQKDKLPEFHDPNEKVAPGVNPNQYKSEKPHHEHNEDDPHLHLEDQDNMDHEKEHIKQHMNFTDTENMSPEELRFYYFKMNDYDDDDKLDGRELIGAMIHHHGIVTMFK